MPKKFEPVVELRNPNELTPYINNNKQHPDEQIDKVAGSIAEFGCDQPLVIDADGVIIKGHARREAALRLGLDKVPVIVRNDLSEAQKKASRIADNRTAISDFDEQAIALEFEALKELEYDLSQTGFDSNEIDELLKLNGSEGYGGGTGEENDLPDVDEVQPREGLVAGSIWALGRHRLMVSDCTNPDNVKKLMDGSKAVLMATDPPYGDSWVQKAKDMAAHGYGHSHAVLHGSIESDDLPEKDLATFLDKFLSAAKLAGDPPFPTYVWHRAKRMIFEQSLLDAGYLVHQPVVWVKPGFVIGRLHYHPRCEWALHGWLRGNGKCPFYGDRNQSDVWEVARENDKIHPTQKPVELFLIPINNHTLPDEIAYDPFLGSGTCLMAAEQSARRCFGFEIQLNYAEVIMQRFFNLTKIEPELIHSP